MITFSWCFKKLQKNVFVNLSYRSWKVFFPAPGLALQAAFKKAEVKKELSTDIYIYIYICC